MEIVNHLRADAQEEGRETILTLQIERKFNRAERDLVSFRNTTELSDTFKHKKTVEIRCDFRDVVAPSH